jgi:putative spermidine/putrescine transport system substrate-binding protein
MFKSKLASGKLVGFVSILFSSIASLTPVFAGEFDGVTLRVGTFGGSWKENIEAVIVPKFEAMGGKMEFVTGSPNQNLAQVIAARGNAPFDVMEILDAQVADIGELGYLQPLDYSKIPNAPQVVEYRQNDMMMGSWDSQEVICYDTEYFAANNIPAPTTYKDLVRPELAGRILFPDINSGGGLANLGAVAYATGGDEQNITAALELIKEMDITKFWSRGGEVVASFQSNDIYAAVAGAGWCVRTFKAGEPVAAVHPQIDGTHTGVAKIGWLGVMKSSDNAVAANWFVNEFISNEFQQVFAEKTGLMPVNHASISRLSEDELVSKMLVLDAIGIEKQLRLDYSKVVISDWTDQWSRSVSQ